MDEAIDRDGFRANVGIILSNTNAASASRPSAGKAKAGRTALMRNTGVRALGGTRSL